MTVRHPIGKQPMCVSKILVNGPPTGRSAKKSDSVVFHVFQVTFLVGILVAANCDGWRGMPEIQNFVIGGRRNDELKRLSKVQMWID
jgi:hypothetical protein